jgi:hypothetical protein
MVCGRLRARVTKEPQMPSTACAACCSRSCFVFLRRRRRKKINISGDEGVNNAVYGVRRGPRSSMYVSINTPAPPYHILVLIFLQQRAARYLSTLIYAVCCCRYCRGILISQHADPTSMLPPTYQHPHATNISVYYTATHISVSCCRRARSTSRRMIAVLVY